MADPSGPTVAGDPDEIQSPPSGSDGVEAPPATAAPTAPAGDGDGEQKDAPPEAAVDDTGTVQETASVDDWPNAVRSEEPATETQVDEPPVPVVADVPPPTSPPKAEESEPDADDSDGRDKDDAADVTARSDGDGPGGDEEDDAFDDDDEAGEPRRRGGLLTKQVQVDARMILIVGAVFALLVGAFLYGQRQGREAASPAAGPRTTNTTAFTLPKDFVTFEDKDTGVKMSVPKDWTRYSTKDLDPAIRMAVGIPNTSDTVVVRVNSFSSEVTQANVGDQKNVFDQLLAGEKIEILVNQATTLKGLPALFYVYRFTDEPTGVKGYHAHYFVFQGRKMVSVIFQALPEARYAVLAPVFDTIASSLEIAPGPPPAFLDPVAGSTTVPAAGTPVTPTTVPPPPTTG